METGVTLFLEEKFQRGFDATILALDAETSALGMAIARRSFDATISVLDAEMSAIARSSGDIGAEFLAIAELV